MTLQIPDRPATTGGSAGDDRLDAVVARARTAATAFRELDQEAVDRIVWAMSVAGLEHAIDLAELAMEETGFGVLEDKVVKNYVATEFLYDHLKDKKSVGVIDEDVERAIRYVAEPVGVVLALLPITNPTSTALFKSIVAAKTRNAVIFRPSARAVRCATRAIELLQAAGEAAGLPPDTLQVVPDATLDTSQYLFHHAGVDLIWTTGGPQGGRRDQQGGQAVHQRRAGQRAGLRAPQRRPADGGRRRPDLQDVRRLRHLPRRADGGGRRRRRDEVVAELERMGARVLAAEEVGRARARRVRRGRPGADGGARALVRRPRGAGRVHGRGPRQGAGGAAAVRPRPSWRRIRWCRRSSCRCWGSCVRRRSSTGSRPACW